MNAASRSFWAHGARGGSNRYPFQGWSYCWTKMNWGAPWQRRVIISLLAFYNVIQFSCSRPTNQITVFSRLNWFYIVKCPQCKLFRSDSTWVPVNESLRTRLFSARALAMSSKCQWVPRAIKEAIREAGLEESQFPEPEPKARDRCVAIPTGTSWDTRLVLVRECWSAFKWARV